MESTEHPNVSRGTLALLNRYEALIKKWNPTINLISKSTLNDIHQRHIADSLQLLSHLPTAGKVVDMGSGGGFPGLILAIACRDNPDVTITLIESDQRKAAFLRTAVRELAIQADVSVVRIEDAEPQNAATVTARALAPLDKLLSYANRHLQTSGQCLFLKGEGWAGEVEAAKKNWRFQYEAVPSNTNPGSVILKIGDIERV